jgi:hypothetical protein
MNYIPPSGYTPNAPPANNLFVNSLSKLSDKDLDALLKELKQNPEANASQINAVIDELLGRKKSELQSQASGGDAGAGQDLQTLDELMQKLKSGTITDDELQTLALMMGIDPEMLQGMNSSSNPGT